MTKDTFVGYVRAYTVKASDGSPQDERKKPAPSRISYFGMPWDGPVFVFDTETTIDTRQAMKVGFYRIHGMNKWKRERFIERYGDEYQQALDTNDDETVAYITDMYRDACDRLIDEGMFHNPV